MDFYPQKRNTAIGSVTKILVNNTIGKQPFINQS